RLAVGVLLLDAVGHEVDAHGGLDQRVEGEGVAEGLLEGRPVAQRNDVEHAPRLPRRGRRGNARPSTGHVTRPCPENPGRPRPPRGPRRDALAPPPPKREGPARPSLVEGLSRFVGRVEILALGLDDKRRAAEAALARGRPLEAREAARDILKEVPDSLV